MMQRRGLAATADGEIFRGVAVGAEGMTTGEAVFNTSMTGYQEILTDPSYAGQVVVMTSPHIGNYGVTREDDQSEKPALSGFILKTLARRYSNWRAEGPLDEYLAGHGVVALADVDTRRLTRHIRDRGAMPIAIGSDVDESELKAVAASAPTMEGQNLVVHVSTRQVREVPAQSDRLGRVVAIDLGIKRDIVTALAQTGFEVSVVPHDADAQDILDSSPDGVFLSNGPGDPEPLEATIATVRSLLGRVPIFGICLGHQVLGLAVGASTYKLPFGHHGGNHPVRRMADGVVEVTSQNHGFAVDLWPLANSFPPTPDGLASHKQLPASVDTEFGEVLPTHQNLNDGTLEGMSIADAAAFSVQYHPEAAPGPHDASPLFGDFAQLVDRGV